MNKPKSNKPRRFRAKSRAGSVLAIRPEAMSAVYESRDLQAVCDIVDGIAILYVEGPTTHKPGWFFDCYESIVSRFRTAMLSEEVLAVLLKLDTPGGDASGVFEAVAEMLNIKAAAGKPVYAFADEECYSAGYALSCVADETYLPESGGLGSIGVIAHMGSYAEADKKAGFDVRVITSGARKADGDPNIPITDEAEAEVQKRVDGLAQIFFRTVATARGLSVESVQKLEANSFYGESAVTNGLADGVMSLADLMSAISTSLGSPKAIQMAGILKLTKELNDAKAALDAAKSTKAKNLALAGLALAESKLAKKMAEDKKCEDEDEEASTAKASDEDDEDEDDEDEEDDEDSKKSKKKAEKLLAQLQALTGKTSPREILGALTAQSESASRIEKLEAANKRHEATSKADKIEKLIDEGKQARKITPGNEEKVREFAAEYGAKALKGYLEAAPAAVAQESAPAPALVPGLHLTDEAKKIWANTGLTPTQMEAAAKKLQEGGPSTTPAFPWTSVPKGVN
jgi:ClpP class serine protease